MFYTNSWHPVQNTVSIFFPNSLSVSGMILRLCLTTLTPVRHSFQDYRTPQALKFSTLFAF